MRRFLQVFLKVVALSVCAFAQRQPLVVVANMGDNTATIYADTGAALRQLKVLPTGKLPREVCMSPDGKRAYITNREREETTVTVIDLDALRVVATFRDPNMKSPDTCLVSPDSQKLYVSAAFSDAVFIFSTADGRKLGEMKTGHEPRRLLLSKDGTKLFVTHGEDRFVAVFDLKTLTQVGKIPAGRNNRAIAYTPDGNNIVIANVNDDAIQFVSAATLEPEYIVGVPPYPGGFVFHPEKPILFTTSRYEGVLSMLDLAPGKMYGRFKSAIKIGPEPWATVLSHDRTALYVTSIKENRIIVFDLQSMQPRSLMIPTGKGPEGMAVRPD